MSESVLWLHPAIACVRADIMLHRVMRPVAASPGACDYAASCTSPGARSCNGDYPPLVPRGRGGLGSFTSTLGDTYVGGRMLLWRHRAGICVPAGRKNYPPLAGNASCGRAIGREITKVEGRVRVYFASSV